MEKSVFCDERDSSRSRVDASRIVKGRYGGYGKANVISKLFWWWIEPLFFTGVRKKNLEQTDLCNLAESSKSHILHRKMEKYWEAELRRRTAGKNPRLWIAMFKLIAPNMIAFTIFVLVEMVLLLAQAILVGLVTEYFSGDITDERTRNVYLFGGALVVLFAINGFMHAHAFAQGQVCGMRARIALTGLIYKKILSLSLETVGETTIGKIVNLASSDVQRIDTGLEFAPMVLISPVYLLASLAVLWLYLGLGPSALVGMGTMVLYIPLFYVGGKIFAKLRLASTKRTDERVKVMNEIISGIRVIKMYGWEHAFKKTIADIRKKEARLILLAGIVRALMFAAKEVVHLLPLSFMLTVFVLTTGQPLTPQIVFSSLAVFGSVRLVCVSYSMRSIVGLEEIKVALSRIQEFLLCDQYCPFGSYKTSACFQSGFTDCNRNGELAPSERDEDIKELLLESECSKEWLNSSPVANQTSSIDLSYRISCKENTALTGVSDSASNQHPRVVVEQLTAAWRNNNQAEDGYVTLKDISFHCDMNKRSRALAIVGPVGAGKSTILQCLLGELQPLSGTVEVRGSIGYAAQDSWVFSGSVRENVLFGEEFDEDWYSEVLEECCLKEDMSVLPFGDLTLVGERGVTLSGGQKARISLARAMYRKSSVYLLDDPLSAVDAAVGRRLFQICMSGALKNSIVVLVTHHLQYARLADSMLVLDKGESLAYGTYDEVMNMINEGESSDCHTRLKTVLSEMEEGVRADEIRDDVLIMAGKDVLTDKSDSYDKKSNGFLTDGDSESLAVSKCDMLSTLIPPPDACAPSMPILSLETVDFEAKVIPLTAGNSECSEDKAQGSVTIKTYYQYFKAGGGLVGCLILFCALAISEVSVSVTEWFLAEWSKVNQTCSAGNSTDSFCNLAVESLILTYFGLTVGATLLSLLKGVLFICIAIHAAKVLHNRMFAAVLRAPIRFFDTNPIGRVLNRFSKDLHFLDDVLPLFFHEYFMISLRFVSFLVVAGVANPYVFIPVVIVVVVFLMVRWYYLTTARQIKRLEAVARSPLFSHITASLQGLTTIRACGRQGASLEYFHAYQDEQTKGWSAYVHGSRWLGLRVDLLVSLYGASVIFLSISLAGSLDVGLVGLSILYALELCTLCQYTIKTSTEVESLMISAERLLSYGDLQSEAPLGTPPGRESPPSSWPHSGDIRLDKLNYRYSSNTPYVLRDITAHIQPTEKIGIIGRTGAGKSSIIQALFRMAEPEGGFEIDGIPITEVGLHQLRQNISIIPQDPVLFSGSVRYNLDPFSQYSDEEIWTALEQVQLKSHMENMEHHLESPVSEGGTNFSVGQRQLMCLGRALLRKNNILVIDEATANVDMTTDAIIQETIRREFSGCTTLTIAHRLHTIMDADRILVLSGGRVVEFDRPHLLLSSPSSLLYGMVEQMGEGEAQRLREIAGEAYAKSQENLMW